ncbi:MAG TPA: phosphoenolpyruvate carboxykinase, partial [Gammaproteobacteria bacterium]|nr:phosphoenolpyruvate carboxykinase [Gammaproteobacteria bacterium]
MNTRLQALSDWVAEVTALTQPDRVHWCDGSADEYQAFVEQMLASGDLIELNQEHYPGCYLHRSDPRDVARVEHLTYVCTSAQEDAGPNNHWMAPAEARKMMLGFFDGCMKGRTMYVIPYCMGPLGSQYARYGVEITDSAYVAANMYLMTRMGKVALEQIEAA